MMWLADNSFILFLIGLGAAAKWLFLDNNATCALPNNQQEDSHETI